MQREPDVDPSESNCRKPNTKIKSWKQLEKIDLSCTEEKQND